MLHIKTKSDEWQIYFLISITMKFFKISSGIIEQGGSEEHVILLQADHCQLQMSLK